LIFDKFYRFHYGDAQQVYGHGLGLYIVRRLLQTMNGDIRVENLDEGGAAFTFWLPTIEE
jgi:K+-sensing histidine kinase KdpD